jgi:tetratricopeptide (TPR) repeat protein
MSTDDLQAIINRITNKQYTEEDITLLQKLVTGNPEIALQLGKYNVNIGEGKEIHIGDRFYPQPQWSEEAIKALIQTVEGNKEAIIALLKVLEKINIGEQTQSHHTLITSIVIDESRRQISYWQPRDEEIAAIKTWLKEGANLIGITGFGGYGKSTLVSKVFEDQSLGFDQRIWINFSQSYSFNQLGNWLLKDLTQNHYQSEQIINDTDLINKLCQQLCAKNIFLVFDNLETLFSKEKWLDDSYCQFLKQWIEYGKNSKILLTTRKQPDLPNDNKSCQWLNLKGLNLESAIELLKQQKIHGTLEELRAFVNAVDGHPLLIKIVATFLKNRYGNDVNIRFWKKHEINLLTTIGLHRGDQEANINTIFTEVFEQLSPQLQNLLLNISVYRHSFNFEQAKALLPEQTLSEEKEFVQLTQYCLLQELYKRDNNYHRLYNFQPLIRYCVEQKISESQLFDAHQLAINYYQRKCKTQNEWQNENDIFEYLEIFYHHYQLKQHKQAWKTIKLCDEFLELRGYSNLLVENYTNFYNQLSKESDIDFDTSEILLKMGNAYRSIGDFDKAIGFYEKSHKESIDNKNIEIQCRSLLGFGSTYAESRKYELANKYLEESSHILQFLQQIESKQIESKQIESKQIESKILINSGNIKYLQGDYNKCIKCYEQSLSIVESINIAILKHREMSNVLGNLGNAYFQIRDYKRSREKHNHRLELSHNIGDLKGEINSLFALSILSVIYLNFFDGFDLFYKMIDILHETEIPIDSLALPKWFSKFLRKSF